MTPRNKNRGRILRVKQGYNPNSSSIGSDVPVFLAAAAGAGVVAAFILSLMSLTRKRIADAVKQSCGPDAAGPAGKEDERS